MLVWKNSTSPAATFSTGSPDGGGGGVATMVSAALPLCPSLVAVMVASPSASRLTRPFPLTLASSGRLLAGGKPPVVARPLACTMLYRSGRIPFIKRCIARHLRDFIVEGFRHRHCPSLVPRPSLQFSSRRVPRRSGRAAGLGEAAADACA